MVVMEIFESDVAPLFAPFFDIKSAEVPINSKLFCLGTAFKIVKSITMQRHYSRTLVEQHPKVVLHRIRAESSASVLDDLLQANREPEINLPIPKAPLLHERDEYASTLIQHRLPAKFDAKLIE